MSAFLLVQKSTALGYFYSKLGFILDIKEGLNLAI